MLVLGTLLMLAGTGAIGGVALLAAAAILLREVLVSGLREALGRDGVPLATATLAKWKTVAQMASLAILIAGSLAGRIHPVLPDVGAGLLWVAAALAVWTGGSYAAEAVRRLR